MLEVKNPILKGLDKVVRGIVMISLGATTLIIGAACILRFFHINFAGFEELATLTAFWLYMMGSAHGSREKSQITADILEVMLPASRGKDIIILAKWLLTFVLCCIFTYWAFNLVMWTVQTGSRTVVFRIPMGLLQSSILVGMILSCLYNFLYLLREIRYFTGKEARPVESKDAAAEEGG